MHLLPQFLLFPPQLIGLIWCWQSIFMLICFCRSSQDLPRLVFPDPCSVNHGYKEQQVFIFIYLFIKC